MLVAVFVFVCGFFFCFCWWVLLLHSLPPLMMMVLFGVCWNPMAALIFCCYLQSEEEVGVCVEFGFLGLKNERVFSMELRDLG